MKKTLQKTLLAGLVVVLTFVSNFAYSQLVDISGPFTVNCGQVASYTIVGGNSTCGYFWTFDYPGGSYSTSSSGASVSYTWPYSGSGSMTVSVSAVCGTSSRTIGGSIISQSLATPGYISGSTSMCNGNQRTFSISAVSGATTYRWVFPSGFSIVGGSGNVYVGGSTSVTVNVPASGNGNGTVQVRAQSSNTCYTNSSYKTKSIYWGTQPISITGLNEVCVNVLAQYYATTGRGHTNYSWSVPGDWSILSGGSSSNMEARTGEDDGYVTVQATSCGTTVSDTHYVQTNDNGCSGGFGRPELAGGIDWNSLEVYPNPAEDQVTIRVNADIEMETVSVFSQVGQKVMELTPNTSTISLDLSQLDNGIYFIQIENASSSTIKKIVVN